MEVSKRESILLLKKEMCPNRRGIQKQCKSLLHLRQCKPYDNREKEDCNRSQDQDAKELPCGHPEETAQEILGR